MRIIELKIHQSSQPIQIEHLSKTVYSVSRKIEFGQIDQTIQGIVDAVYLVSG